MTQTIFHLSLPVRCIEAAKDFYCTYLGATVGRDSGEWSDILIEIKACRNASAAIGHAGGA